MAPAEPCCWCLGGERINSDGAVLAPGKSLFTAMKGDDPGACNARRRSGPSPRESVPTS
jgi:hypothetical protein